MPTEEFKFEDLIKEYIEVIESTDVPKLKEENKIIKVDIERKGREEADIDARIEQIQTELDSLNENPTVKLEYPEAIKDKEDKLKEAKAFKENKAKEIEELKIKTKENNKKIRQANNIGKDVIKRAEEITNKKQEEIEKKIAELEERKAKYGIKRKDKDGKEYIKYTEEEQGVINSIDKEIDVLKHEIRDNKKEFLIFKKAIEDAKKDKGVYEALKNKVKGKEEVNREEPEEKPESEQKDKEKPKEESNDKNNREQGEILSGANGAKVHFGDGTKTAENTNPTVAEPKKETESRTVNPTSTREGKGETKGKVTPGVPQPEHEIHEVKDPKEDILVNPAVDPTKDPKEDILVNPAADPTKGQDVYSSSYKQALDEYKAMLSMYKDAFLSLGDLQQQYENGEIDYSEYEEQALYVAERYEFMKDEYAKIKARYDIEKGKEDEFSNKSNEELENRLKELDEETTELWQQGVHENTPDEKRYHEALEEIKRIKEELNQRKENPLRGMTIEELEAKKHELYGRIGEQQEPDEYEFRTHKENGLEGYEEDDIDRALREIREEIERRQPKLEAPEEPDKAGMILEDKGKEPPKENDLPKEFDEILFEVQAAKNAMSDAELGRYEAAKGKWLVPVKYDKGDWLRNTARFITQKVFGSMINIPRKAYSWLRTGKEQKEKMANIIENVDKLSAEDFEVLAGGLMAHEGHTNGVSASLRKAVRMRAEREVSIENKKKDQEIIEQLNFIKTSHERSKEISERLAEEGLSEEERQSLIQEKMQLDKKGSEYIESVKKMRKEAAIAQGGLGIHGLEEEDRAAREGSNLAGRKFAKRYSNNEELEKQQAELSRMQRESKAKGDDFNEVEAFIKHEQLLEENTTTKKIMGITVSRGDRNHATGVFTKEYKDDDLLRNVVTIATVVATTINMIKQIQNARALAEHNAKIQQADIANKQSLEKAEQLRQEILNNEEVINKGIEGTDATRTAAGWGIGHEGAATPYNYTGGWGSKDLDKAFHQIINGNVTDQTIKDFIEQGGPAIRAYAQAHPQFDYTALLDSMQKLGNGGIEAITQYNNVVRDVVELAKNMGEITSTSVGALNLSSTYIETMIPLVMTGRAVTTKEYRRALREVERKEGKEKEGRKTFREMLKFRKSKEKGKTTQEETHDVTAKEEGKVVEQDDGREV